MRAFFEARTPRVLAKRLSAARSPGAQNAAPAVPAAAPGRFTMTDAQAYFFAEDLASGAGFGNNCVLAWRAAVGDGSLPRRDVLQRAMTTLAERHPSLRCVVRLRRGIAHLVETDAATPSIRQIEGSGTLRDVLRQAARVRHRATGPRLWFPFLARADDGVALGISGHHTILDGTSASIIARDLSDILFHLDRGVPAALPPPPPLPAPGDLGCEPAVFAPGEDAHGPLRRRKADGHDELSVEIGPERHQAVLAVARELRISPGTVYYLAALDAYAAVLGERPGFKSVFDLRSAPHRDGLVGCYIAFIDLEVTGSGRTRAERLANANRELMDCRARSLRTISEAANLSRRPLDHERLFIYQDTQGAPLQLPDGRRLCYVDGVYAEAPAALLIEVSPRRDDSAHLCLAWRDHFGDRDTATRLTDRLIEALAGLTNVDDSGGSGH